MPALKAVFLDAGGTLLHPDRAFIVDQLLRHGAELPADLGGVEAGARALVRSMLVGERPGDDAGRLRLFWEAFARHAGCPDEGVDAVVEAIMARHREGRLWRDVEPAAPETLDALREAGYTLGVVSNSDGRVAELLERAGLRHHFSFVIDSGEEGVEKPDPRIFELACERAGVACGEAVHVGDIYEIDVVGAEAAGVGAILIDRGDAVDADCVRITSLRELPGLLAHGAVPGQEG